MTETLISITDVPALIEVATKAAREAGQYLREHLGRAEVQHRKALKDDLLDVDLASERIIIDRLKQAAPHIGFLSEEAGIIGRQDQYWTIDPVDGSANFQHGNPDFATSIALIVNQTTVGGVIYIPCTDELFTAIQGQGAYRNGQKISIAPTTTLQDALVYYGDISVAASAQIFAESINNFTQVAAQAHRTRIIGTTVTELAYVACGKADALISPTINPWDVSAGRLLVTEAGGKITPITATSSRQLFLYSNEDLIEAVNQLFATSAQ
ncbi:MAG TPA: inositol monophosphatase [Dictyobacter sp.]|jgi:myo-inositol-1(or 4)-monophosphatase|nr:inositol monophosphatase [Dictyobacter sp.]